MSLCEATHSLPSPGGLLDQDAAWIEKMKLWFQVRGEKAKLDEQMSKKPMRNTIK